LHRPVVIGITGGIGSGKSTVAKMLASLGAEAIDADLLGHEALERDDIREAIRKEWGAGVIDANGRVDRKALAAVAFASEEQTRRLNAIVHPPLLADLRQRLEACQAQAAVIDAALLTEWCIDSLCDVAVFVDAPQAVRSQRVAASRGWQADELARREAQQHSLEEKKKRSQYVVENGADQTDTLKQVVQFWNENVRGLSEQKQEGEQKNGQRHKV
jgi:dephospho-CoA kinase